MMTSNGVWTLSHQSDWKRSFSPPFSSNGIEDDFGRFDRTASQKRGGPDREVGELWFKRF